MTDKIKTKADLIAFIQSLPDDWVPVQCVSWKVPEAVAVGFDYDVKEIRQHLEIRIDGPTLIKSYPTGPLGGTGS